jgi:hypothetical protein
MVILRMLQAYKYGRQWVIDNFLTAIGVFIGGVLFNWIT